MTHYNGHVTTHDLLTANTHYAAPLPLPSPPTSRYRGGDRLEQMVTNFFQGRIERYRRLADPRRNIAEECGHPTDYTAENYLDLYHRNGLAARVVEVYAKEAWKVSPSVYEDEDSEAVTPFERDWDALGSMLSGGSKFKQEEGSPVYDLLRDADIQCGIGRYGVILLGLDDLRQGDGRSLASAATPRKGQKLLYARAVSEAYAKVTKWENDKGSPRFCQPTEYQITFGDPTQNRGDGPSATTELVHWTRCVHLSDSGRNHALPRLEQVLPYVLDATKILGADAEAVWQQIVAATFFETPPDFEGAVDSAGTKEEYEKLIHGLQRAMVLNNLTAKKLPPNLADPGPHLAAQIRAICIRMDVPERTFMGSEMGRLAADQDARKWSGTVRAHRQYDTTPRKIAPFVDRLIYLGVLSEPAEQYCVWWPDAEAQTEQEKATVALTTTQALAQYVSGSVEAVVPPMDYLTRIHGWSEEEAEAVLENAEGLLAEVRAEEARAEEEARQAMASGAGKGGSDDADA